MDVKYVFAVRSRCNQIVVDEGVLPHNFNAQYKSPVGQKVYIVITGYVLNDNNKTKM